MLQRIKNWLIKKLGGYTKAEYDDMGRFPIAKFEFIPQPDRRDIVTLRTEGAFDNFASPPTEWIEDRLCGELASQIKPYVRFERNDDYCNMKTTIRATVKVVSCNY